MALPKELLEKIINLRDLRHAITAVKAHSLKKEESAAGPKPISSIPYETYKKRYLSGELPITHVPHNMVEQLHAEGHIAGKPYEEYKSRHEGEDKTEVIPRDYTHPTKEMQPKESLGDEGKKSLGVKYLGTKRGYGSVVHMFGVPGHHQHYEVSVNKLSPKTEHSVKLVQSADGSTISRSPNTHMDIKSAASDLVNHFYNKKWK